MKRIIKTTEQKWKCQYCGYLNVLKNTTCEKCSSIRKGDEVVQEITTNYEETTTTTEGDKPSNYIIAVDYTRITIIVIAAALLIIGALAFFFSSKAIPVNDNNENYTVVNKEWQYTVSIGEFVEEKDLTSFNKPPFGAKNIRTRQVQQSNGWYKTEYVYDFDDWKVVKTETISGSKDIPTYKEYNVAEGEKIMSRTTARFSVTCMTPSGRQVFTV